MRPLGSIKLAAFDGIYPGSTPPFLSTMAICSNEAIASLFVLLILPLAPHPPSHLPTPIKTQSVILQEL